MDIQKIEALIKLINDSNLSEIEITEGKSKVRLSKQTQQIQQPIYAAQPQAIPSTPPHQNNLHNVTAIELPSETSDISINTENTTGTAIKSPMVGTFYKSPSPGSDPFIKIGQKINIGDTICIIEAMKIMNKIESEHTGIIKEILASDGSPVEFDQPLIIIE